MLLIIEELGYKSCWFEGHITDDDIINEKIAQTLNVPNEYELVCYLLIGIAKDEVVAIKKKHLKKERFLIVFKK